MSIVVLFHISGYRNFKTFYIGYVQGYLKNYFPRLPSYNPFVELKQSAVIPLHCYLMSIKGKASGISFIDLNTLSLGHPKRLYGHKVFKGIAKKGRSSMGWFYGFKLHVVVNEHGELLAFMITPGNVDDRKPVPKLCQACHWKVDR